MPVIEIPEETRPEAIEAKKDPLLDRTDAKHLKQLMYYEDIWGDAHHRLKDDELIERLKREGQTQLLEPKSSDDCLKLLKIAIESCPYITFNNKDMAVVLVDYVKEEYVDKCDEAKEELLKLVTICGKYKKFRALRNLKPIWIPVDEWRSCPVSWDFYTLIDYRDCVQSSE